MTPDAVADFMKLAIRTLVANRLAPAELHVDQRVRAAQALWCVWLNQPSVATLEFKTRLGLPIPVDETETDRYLPLILESLAKQASRDGGVPGRIYRLIMERAPRLRDATSTGRRQGVDSRSNSVNERNNITGQFCYTEPVGKDVSSAKSLTISWNREDSDMTAYEFFEAQFGHLPFEERPTADQVHQASQRFYRTLAQHQYRQGKSIHDLFPADPAARGGSKAKIGGELTYDRLLASLERKRDRGRIAQARHRARQRTTRDDPG